MKYELLISDDSVITGIDDLIKNANTPLVERIEFEVPDDLDEGLALDIGRGKAFMLGFSCHDCCSTLRQVEG